MLNVVTMMRRSRPALIEGIVELEKRSDGSFYLEGVPVRVRPFGGQPGQGTSPLEIMARRKSAPLEYTVDPVTEAILVSVVEEGINCKITLYEIL